MVPEAFSVHNTVQAQRRWIYQREETPIGAPSVIGVASVTQPLTQPLTQLRKEAWMMQAIIGYALAWTPWRHKYLNMHSVGLQLTVILFCAASVFWSNCDAAASKEGKTSSSTQTDPPASSMSVMEFIAAMPVTAQLRTGAVFVAFLAILFWDRRADTWIKSLVALGALGGLAYYFNPANAGHVSRNATSFHVAPLPFRACNSNRWRLADCQSKTLWRHQSERTSLGSRRSAIKARTRLLHNARYTLIPFPTV